jgi:K+ transporter
MRSVTSQRLNTTNSVVYSAWTNPFFNAAPPGMLYPSLIVAILAAIVASQAIITATFQASTAYTTFTSHAKHV